MQIVNPKRVSHRYTQSLAGTPDEVFPLLCPVREVEWVPGWRPVEVRSASGIAELDCVFKTPAGPVGDATWMVTQYDPVAKRIQFVKLTPATTACRLDITVTPDGEGSKAEVTYSHTSLGPLGDAFIDEQFTAEHYLVFMKEWEDCMNAFLLASRAPRAA